MTPTASEAALPSGVRPLLRAVARAVVPASAHFDEARWTTAEAVVAAALAARAPAVRRQVFLFFRVLDGLARVRFGRSLAALEPSATARLLRWLERAPLLLLRRGVWGVRTLAFMGCYGTLGARRAVGYDARLRGWRDRGADQGGWPDRAGAAPPEGWVVPGNQDAPDA